MIFLLSILAPCTLVAICQPEFITRIYIMVYGSNFQMIKHHVQDTDYYSARCSATMSSSDCTERRQQQQQQPPRWLASAGLYASSADAPDACTCNSTMIQ